MRKKKSSVLLFMNEKHKKKICRPSRSTRTAGRPVSRKPHTRTFGGADDRRLSGCGSDPNEQQAIGAREQDEAQAPCCHPHLPNDMCVRYTGACTGYCGRAKRVVVVVFGRSYGGGRGSRPGVGAAGRRGGSRYWTSCRAAVLVDTVRSWCRTRPDRRQTGTDMFTTAWDAGRAAR